MKMKGIPGTMMLQVRAVIRNKEGEILREIPWRRSHSFVKQFLDFIYCAFLDDIVINLRKTDGDLQGVSGPDLGSYTFLDLTGGINDDQVGIVIGRGDDAEWNQSYALSNRILDGSSLNQMEFGETTFGDTWVDGSSALWNVYRVFSNNSGATITIKEIALYCEANDITTYQFMIARDLLTVVVADGENTTIEYRMQITV